MDYKFVDTPAYTQYNNYCPGRGRWGDIVSDAYGLIFLGFTNAYSSTPPTYPHLSGELPGIIVRNIQVSREISMLAGRVVK